MTRALLVAGPPHSRALWADVQRRLDPHFDVQAVSLVLDHPSQPSVAGQAAWVASQLASCAEPPVIVAHGLACPVAIQAASRVPGCRLVLANGPVARLDPITRVLSILARQPALLASTLFHPNIVIRWLYSSAGLRRAVRNPYVMDRDTVVAICSPVFADPPTRRALSAFLEDLPRALRSTPSFEGPCLLLWGDEDRLYPPAEVDRARLRLPALTHLAVLGGRQLHPVERPWEVADAIVAWMHSG